ncbi:MAG: sulfatase [Puniceicoccaceae bacterium]
MVRNKSIPILTILCTSWILGLKIDASDQRERFLPEGNYNVLFIPIDDFRVLTNAYGETEPLRPITPHMDRLTDSGVSFANAHCQQAVCNASRASLLTGLRPDSTRCWKLQTFFRDMVGYDLKTLPQHFAEHGYTTHGIGKIYHSTNSTSQDDNPTGSRSWSDGWFNAQGPQDWYQNPNRSATDAGEVEDNAYDDGVAAEAGVAKIAEYATDYHANGTPFFLAVGFKKPHMPFNAPKRYWDWYDPSEIDLTGYDGSHDMPIGTNAFTAPYGGEPASYNDIVGHPETKAPNATDARRLIHGYLACASYIDAQVGKLLDALEDPDGDPETDDSITESTIVVLWSDHGFFLGEHNGFWAKHCNYEIATRVPLIFRAPGLDTLGSAGKFCSAPVELIDIYPTLVEICSLPQPTQPEGMALQGTSLLPLLEDPRQPWKKAAFSQYQRNINDNGSSDVPLLENYGNHQGMGYSIRTDRFRYTEWWRTVSSNDTVDLHVPLDSSPAHIELYDHLTDPGETINLASNPAYAQLMDELSILLNDPDPSFAGDGWKSANVDAPAKYPTTLEDWTAGHLFPGMALNDLAPDADPDADGLANLLEYSFGTHPMEADGPMTLVSVDPSGFHMRYPVVLPRTDISLHVVQSSTLLPDSWTATGVTIQDGPAKGHFTMRNASVPLPAERAFFRLRSQGSD